MKQLELTEFQKQRLLTMVEIKYRHYIERSVAGSFLHLKSTTGELVAIPWFEFCIKHLIYDFLNDSPVEVANELERFAKCIIMVEVHPVDYLWVLFKGQ